MILIYEFVDWHYNYRNKELVIEVAKELHKALINTTKSEHKIKAIKMKIGSSLAKT